MRQIPDLKSKSQNRKVRFLPSLLAALALLAAPALRAAVTVSNVTTAQRPGTKLVDITYDVASDVTNAVKVSLAVSNGVQAVNAVSLVGDVGEGVATGTGKTMVWNVGVDVPGHVAAGVQFYVTADEGMVVPAGMVAIPAGTNSGTDPDFGAYSLTVGAYCMDATEVTKAQWDDVLTWAVAHEYGFDNAGSGKAANHPVQTVSWYDCVKWCNARSEKDGRTPVYAVSGSVYRTGQSIPTQNAAANGYRLPTVAEWEYAARGGLSGKRFPWGDTITHSQANYKSSSSYGYDVSPTRDYHPTYATGGYPYTSPVGAFAANGYGLYDMAGNVSEWCWEVSGSSRNFRSGCWYNSANILRCRNSGSFGAEYALFYYGIRTVCR